MNEALNTLQSGNRLPKRAYTPFTKAMAMARLEAAIQQMRAIVEAEGEMGSELLSRVQLDKIANPDGVFYLTKRETQVLELLAHGYSNNSIAETLVVEHRTVEHHINSLFSKLGLVKIQGMNPRVVATLIFWKYVLTSQP